MVLGKHSRQGGSCSLLYIIIIAVRLTFLTALKPIDIVVNINKILFFD